MTLTTRSSRGGIWLGGKEDDVMPPIGKGVNTQRGQYLSPQTSIHKRAEAILNIEVQQGNRTPPLLHGLVDGRKGLNHLDHKAFGCPCNVYPNPIPTPASPPVVTLPCPYSITPTPAPAHHTQPHPHPKHNHSKGQSRTEGVALPVPGLFQIRSRLASNLVQHHLDHAAVSGTRIQEPDPHNGRRLHDARDLHVSRPLREQWGKVEGHEAGEGRTHGPSSSGRYPQQQADHREIMLLLQVLIDVEGTELGEVTVQTQRQ